MTDKRESAEKQLQAINENLSTLKFLLRQLRADQTGACLCCNIDRSETGWVSLGFSDGSHNWLCGECARRGLLVAAIGAKMGPAPAEAGDRGDEPTVARLSGQKEPTNG